MLNKIKKANEWYDNLKEPRRFLMFLSTYTVLLFPMYFGPPFMWITVIGVSLMMVFRLVGIAK